jgi:hypothetical protein
MLKHLENSLKIRRGAELLHADGRTDMTKLTVALRNVVNGPKTPCMAYITLGTVDIKFKISNYKLQP